MEQHRIGKVYLKQFSHLIFKVEKNCVWYKGEDFIRYKNVESFTAETNLFDIPSFGEKERLFEDLNGMLETDYPFIISEIKETGKLSSDNELILFQFIANLLCRTSIFRERIEFIFSDAAKRERFFEEITMFSNPNRMKGIRAIKGLPNKDTVNSILIFVMEHLLKCFVNFNYCILKEYEERGWITSDNPVVIDYNENYNFIMPPEIEIYFPISKNYCLYMYHPNAKNNNNIIKKFCDKKVIEATEDIQEFVYSKVSDRMNYDKFLIYPWDLGKVNFKKDNFNQGNNVVNIG